MKMKTGFKTVLALSLCFIIAAAFMSCGGKTTIESLAIKPPNINIAVHTTIQFLATGSQSNGVIGDVTTQVTWSSSDTAVATINSSGLLTAVGPGTVTITASAPGNITEQSTLTVSSPSSQNFTVGNNPSAIAIDSVGNVWVVNQGDGTVTELLYTPPPAGPSWAVNPSGPFKVGASPSGIAIDGAGNVWVTNQGDGTITELNSSGQRVSPSPYVVGGNPSRIAIDFLGYVWVTIQGGPYNNEVIKLSLVSGQPSFSAFPVGSGPNGIAIDAANDIWVTNKGSDAVPGTTVTELNSIGSLIGTPTVGFEPDSIAIDPYGNVWVTNTANSLQGSAADPGNTITQLNSVGGFNRTFTLAGVLGLHGIAIDSAGSVWVTVSNDSNATTPGPNLLELSPTDGAVLNTFEVENNPSGIAIDGINNVWVANSGTNTVTVWKDAATGPQFRLYTGPVWPF
jgi:streptogramin lyase